MRWVKKPIAAQMKRAQTNMTYVVDGNKCANIVPQGQYFQLINSTIAGRSDGVYTASKAIPANEVIDSTYFNQTSPIAEGAINKINNELATLNSNLAGSEIPVSLASGNTPTSYTRLSISGGNAVLVLSEKLNTASSGWNRVLTFSNQYGPKTDAYGIFVDNDNTSTLFLAYVSSGNLFIKGTVDNRLIRGQISWIIAH